MRWNILTTQSTILTSVCCIQITTKMAFQCPHLQHSETSLHTVYVNFNIFIFDCQSNVAHLCTLVKSRQRQSILRKKETTQVEWSIVSKVSGSKKGSRRLRRMESYKQNRNAINQLPSRPPEEAYSTITDNL